MNAREKLSKARLGMFARDEELQNLRVTCKRAGTRRRPFSEIKGASRRTEPRAWRRTRPSITSSPASGPRLTRRNL